MSRLSIEIPDHQHQQIKAMAAINGLSLKDYILERTLSPAEEPYSDEELYALEQLNKFLAPRIAEVERGNFSYVSMQDIIDEARKERGMK